jgi:hypothetical protein
MSNTNTKSATLTNNSTAIGAPVYFDQLSRLTQYPVIYDPVQGVNRLGNKNFNTINIIRNNVPYNTWVITTNYQYRPDSISYLFYGRPDLWWVLTGYNGFFNGPEDFYVNRVIMIPQSAGVLSTLTT